VFCVSCLFLSDALGHSAPPGHHLGILLCLNPHLGADPLLRWICPAGEAAGGAAARLPPDALAQLSSYSTLGLCVVALSLVKSYRGESSSFFRLTSSAQLVGISWGGIGGVVTLVLLVYLALSLRASGVADPQWRSARSLRVPSLVHRLSFIVLLAVVGGRSIIGGAVWAADAVPSCGFAACGRPFVEP